MTTKSGMAPVHPGEVLREELDDLDLSASSLAKAIDVPVNRITAILNSERGITADTALRLGRYFDTTTQFWLNLQQNWQIRQAEMDASALSLERIVPRETEALRNAARAMQAASTVPDPTAMAFRAIERNLTLCNQLHNVERSFRILDLDSQLLHAIEGPLEELRTAGVFNTALRNHLAHTTQWLADYENRFRVPSVTEISGLMGKLTADSTRVADSIAASIASLQSPWLDIQNPIGSVERLMDLYDIGDTISRSSSFELAFVERLRRSLGDWRDPITWSPSTWSDLGARADSYVDLGFNTSLTDLTAPAFYEVTRVAEVRPDPPFLVEAYGTPVATVSDPIEEVALARTNEAHDWLQRLESQLRHFIDDGMTETFGPNWPTRQLPNNKYDEWNAKKETADRSGAPPRPLIAYADFTDYVLIICRRDNWNQVFSPYFERPESVRESFQRLYPIRHDAMHARPITQDDELLLYVETKRLMQRISSP